MEGSRRLHFDVDAKLSASIQLCAKNPTLECMAPFFWTWRGCTLILAMGGKGFWQGGNRAFLDLIVIP